MAGKACSRVGCGMAKSADVHSRHYRGEDGHPFVLDGEYKMGPSEGYRNKMERRRPLTRPMYEQECIAKVLGAHTIPPCSGGPTVHEPWTRGRGGPIDDERNMVPMCAFHNTWVSQDAEGQRWAEANDLLIHAWEGEAWLSAGGVCAPKGWRMSVNRDNEAESLVVRKSRQARESATAQAAPPSSVPKRSRLR